MWAKKYLGAKSVIFRSKISIFKKKNNLGAKLVFLRKLKNIRAKSVFMRAERNSNLNFSLALDCDGNK